jgi:hypothetical protein
MAGVRLVQCDPFKALLVLSACGVLPQPAIAIHPDKHSMFVRYTKAELLQAVEMAHRFGLRVYFDNIMNHRGFDIPGFNSSTPTNLYPGLVPGDFHLRTVGSYFANWPQRQRLEQCQRGPAPATLRAD